MSTMKRTCSVGTLLLTALAWVVVTTPARAQDWPTRAVKFLLPIGAGSGADVGARLIAEKLTASGANPWWSKTGRVATVSSP